MSTKTQKVNKTYPVKSGGYQVNVNELYIDRTWQQSPRVNGVLKIKTLPYTKWKSSYEKWDLRSAKPADLGEMPNGLWRPESHPASKAEYKAGMPSLEAQCYAKFRGKLYKGSTALGVTAGSYKETRRMVVSNYNLWRDRNQWALHRARLNRRNVLFTGSDDYLEYIFGVRPLYEDIRKAVYELCQYATPPEFVSARTSSHVPLSGVYSDDGLVRKWFGGNMVMRCNMSTQVELTQPNLWLAERAGLLNIGSVAWDLVPWSFLLNMFVNLNQLVQSVTDFVGLSFDNGSVTRRSVLAGVHTVIGGYVPYGIDKPYMIGTALHRSDYQVRSPGVITRPPLVVKLPGVNWETAAMAASLMTQQLNRIPVVRNFRNFK